MKKKGLLVTIGLFFAAAIISDTKKQNERLKHDKQNHNIDEN